MKSIAGWVAPVATTIAALMTTSNLGSRSGRPSCLVIAEGGVAGVGEVLRRVEWSSARMEEDRLVTTLTPAGFAKGARLEKDKWPGR